jgi:diguanylate cyclase (GGDEF)-like protein
MKRKPIVFDQLLQRILPVDRLPLADQADIRAALDSADPGRIEKLAFDVIEKLTRLGHLRLIEEVVRGDERIVRYRDLTSANTISIRLPLPEDDSGLVRIPLPLRHARSVTSLEQIRSILTLYNRILGKDSNLLTSVPDILRHLIGTSQHVLGCDRVNFAPGRHGLRSAIDLDPECVSPPYDTYLTDEWVVDRNYLIYIPEIPATGSGRTAVPSGMRSVAMARLGDQVSGVSGTLQAWSSRPHFFTEDKLGLLSLLSESGTDLVARAAALGNLVFVDSGTKVFNRAYFNIQLENEISRAKREDKSLALVIFDIDDFRSVNKQYGYEAGNEVLARVARVLKSGIRPFDSVARWGGEEFAMILTAPIALEDAKNITARLRRAVERHLFSVTGLEGKVHSLSLTISGGGALFPTDASTGTDLWRAANSALMWSKEHGKNQITFFPELAGGEPPLEEKK